MRVCPKCSAFYASDSPGFCHEDGGPLIGLAPGSDEWNAGQRAIEKTNNAVRKKQRRLKIRRIVFTTMAMLVLMRIVYVVAVKGVVHTDDAQPKISATSESPAPTPDLSPPADVSPSPSPNHLRDDEKRTPTPTPTPTPLFQIDGQINYQNGKLPFVIEVQLQGKQRSTITTDRNGNYSFARLPAGDYTVTPRSEGMKFDPPARAVTILDKDKRADFLGTPRGFGYPRGPTLNNPAMDPAPGPRKPRPKTKPKPG